MSEKTAIRTAGDASRRGGVLGWCARGCSRARACRACISAGSTSTASSRRTRSGARRRFARGEQSALARRHARDARRARRARLAAADGRSRRWASGASAARSIVGMVLLATLWAVGLPFGARRPVVAAPLGARAVRRARLARRAVGGARRRGGLGACSRSSLLVGLAGRFRRWWSIAAAIFVGDRGAVRVHLRLARRRRHASAPRSRARAPTSQRLERIEGVSGHAGQRRGRLVVDRPGERVHGRVRPVDARRPLGHAARRPLHARARRTS